MSIARDPEDKADGALEQSQQQHGVEVEGGTVEATSSWKRPDSHNHSSSSIQLPKKSKLEESDEDLFTVPDVESSKAMHNSSTQSGSERTQNTATEVPGRRRRGRNPVDKEYRRLKRLLRNRVSAQQARERKKVYVNELESRAAELQDRNSKLEERISTLINENTMLRKVLLNLTPEADESIEIKQQDQLVKQKLT